VLWQTGRKFTCLNPLVCLLPAYRPSGAGRRTGRKGEFLKMPEANPRWVKKPALVSGKGNFSV